MPTSQSNLTTRITWSQSGPVASLQAEEQVLAASQRPLVVVIEEAEAVDTLTLQDLILVLSEVGLLLPCWLAQTLFCISRLDSPSTPARRPKSCQQNSTYCSHTQGC